MISSSISDSNYLGDIEWAKEVFIAASKKISSKDDMDLIELFITDIDPVWIDEIIKNKEE